VRTGRHRSRIVARAICAARTQRGEPCGAFVPIGATYCRMHDPERADEVQAARLRGVRQANHLRAIEGRRRKLDNPRALSGFLSVLIHDALEGKVEADLARTIGYLVMVQTKVIEQARSADVESALSEVRALVAEARRRGA
jgi:hypothetical protein